ncbi:MAG: hypothetical protein WC273_06790 [Dehalococcoidia bacterium]
MPDLPPPHAVALRLASTWMSERYFRTFRASDDEPGAFDAILLQRDRRVGVTIGSLWEESAPPEGADDLAALLTADMRADGSSIEPGAYAVWVPPTTPLPVTEPQVSNLRVALARSLGGLAEGERREVRLPVTLALAKLSDEGAYVSVTGGLAPQWTVLSEGMPGSFHLDSRALYRLPEEQAEVDIITTQVRDRAVMLQAGEVTEVQVNDTWTVSRLAGGEPAGVTVMTSPREVEPLDGTLVRRMLRRHVQRAVTQGEAARAAGRPADLAALVLVGALAHLKDELATAALRGMNPVAYGALDLIAVVADAGVRQVLQPRSLPWEAAR